MKDNHEPIQALLVDAGNTILGLDYRIMAETLAAGAVGITPEAVERAECRARVALAPLLGQPGGMPIAETFAHFARAIAEPLGLAPDGEGPRRLVEMMLTTDGMDRTWCVPMPGAREALARLHGMGLKLALVSNGDGQGPRRVTEAGLADHFEVLIDSGNVGVEKPDPRIFEIALKRLDLAPADAIHVGDFYEVDVLGARAAGLRDAILIDPYDDKPEADCPRAATMAQVPDLLREMGVVAPD